MALKHVCILKLIVILNRDFEYLKTVNTMMCQQDSVTGVSWKYCLDNLAVDICVYRFRKKLIYR